MDVADYLCVLLGEALGAVYDQKADVGAAHGVKGAHHRIVFDVVLHPALLSYACRVDYGIFRTIGSGKARVYRVARGARNVGDYRAVEAEELVYKARLARVGLAHHGYLYAVVIFCGNLFKVADDFIQEVAYTRAVFGGDGVGLAKTEGIELKDLLFGIFVNLIHNQYDGLFAAAEHVGDVVVGGCKPLPSVDEEQNDLRRIYGDFGLLFYLAPHCILRL